MFYLILFLMFRMFSKPSHNLFRNGTLSVSIRIRYILFNDTCLSLNFENSLSWEVSVLRTSLFKCRGPFWNTRIFLKLFSYSKLYFRRTKLKMSKSNWPIIQKKNRPSKRKFQRRCVKYQNEKPSVRFHVNSRGIFSVMCSCKL